MIRNLDSYITWVLRHYGFSWEGDHYWDVFQECRLAYYEALNEGLGEKQIKNRIRNTPRRYRLRNYYAVKYTDRTKPDEYRVQTEIEDYRNDKTSCFMLDNPSKLCEVIDDIDFYTNLSEYPYMKDNGRFKTIWDLYKQGVDAKEIAKMVGIGWRNVYRAIEKMEGRKNG